MNEADAKAIENVITELRALGKVELCAVSIGLTMAAAGPHGHGKAMLLCARILYVLGHEGEAVG